MALAAFVQRSSGLGFTLVAAPFLLVALGPWDALGIIHLCGALVSTAIAWRLRRSIEWRFAQRLSFGAIVGVVPGVWVTTVADSDVLEVIVGAGVLFACAILVLLPTARVGDSIGRQALVGSSCGFLGAVAGAGGPVLALFGTATDRSPAALAGTMQIVFAVVGAEVLALRAVIGGSGYPQLPALTWSILIVSMLIGALLGDTFLRRMSRDAARAIMLCSAAGGGAAILLHGLS
ncbi:sulfite exporter TauE/SafE family protein [Rhodococcus opacus]|uniref:sulfite exporter TauE/SafE family protein n=1 Tax=Rhodococcus opacus TaxID=37919 RepID=UPI0022368396|nr:sulfite exporter TauE/SafE family protein [Rhodococcus opacus]UZG60217.1 sulfite exporter TauE/SafE family protein [Rhodococcus opacus]